MSATFPGIVTLHYRASFMILMNLAGLIMIVAGPLIVVLSVFSFRPPGAVLGVVLTLSGLRLLRRYWKPFLRRQAAFQFDKEGLHYVAADGYSIVWSSVLGLYGVRRRNRLTDIYFYLRENPASALFVGETDPRSAAFGRRRAEAPNQLHLRLGHFATSKLGDIEDQIRSLAPRQGAFPDGTKILNGHLSSLNVMVFTWLLTIVFGCVAGGSVGSVWDWGIGFLVFASFQVVALLIWGSRRLQRFNPGWATPRLIASDDTLYLPGTALGHVRFDEILNITYGWNGLRLFFTTCQDAIRNFQYNRFGLSTSALIATRGNTKQEMAEFFGDLEIWNNGRRPDLKAARERERRNDAELKRINKLYKTKGAEKH